ncbi:hypothetical protein NN6n1_30760 [Shinella zoogloeoides]
MKIPTTMVDRKVQIIKVEMLMTSSINMGTPHAGMLGANLEDFANETAGQGPPLDEL